MDSVAERPIVGLTRVDESNVCARVWAPRASRVELVIDPEGSAQRIVLDHEPRGYHALSLPSLAIGTRYGFSLDGGETLPDPASRWQPDGAIGPSAYYDPGHFEWDEGAWRGVGREDLVFYEIHVGTLTREGTFDAVVSRLDDLSELGITAIELMPLAQFPGTRGWGYDGVFPFAVQHSYGGPEALHRLINECHRRGLAVFLDLVLNHMGPEGNVLPRYGPYFHARYQTDWGAALNFDGHHSDPVRDTVLELVSMWVRDYRFDGLRLDAADQIYDRGPRSILAEITRVAHSEAARLGRPCHVFAETDMNNAPLFLDPPAQRGYGLDGQWNDDFHHAIRVALTGDTSGYYVDFQPGPAAVAKVYEQVFVNNGVYSEFRGRRHGAPAIDYSGDRFVAFIQNHDQVANGGGGKRIATALDPASARLAAGLMFLAPRLPLIFQGEEYGETRDFPYFCDYDTPELIKAVREGRAREFAHFERTNEPPDPVAQETRDAAVLSWSWSNDPDRTAIRRLYRDLIRLRRELPALRDYSHARCRLHGRSADVLEAVRGGVGPGAPTPIHILFNFATEPRPLPDDLTHAQIVMRSESKPYATRHSGIGSEWLAPREFVVLDLPPADCA